jgi:DNA repair protein RecO (recombination protein O)
MPPLFSRGLILRVSDQGESDKLLQLYSPELGRAAAIAKGAKRSKQRFVNKLEPFSQLEFAYQPSRSSSLLLLVEAELVAAHLALRQQVAPYTVASYLMELLLRFTREGDPDPDLFTLACWALATLDQGAPLFKTAVLFHLRLLSLAGYSPQISHCAACGQVVTQGLGFAMPSGSGDLLCQHCWPQHPAPLVRVNSRILQFLLSGRQMALPLLNRLQLPEQEAWTILALFNRYSQQLLQLDLHAWSAMTTLAGQRQRT